MSEKKVDLCIYRMRSAIETLGVSALCLESQHYKDSINRSYYAAFLCGEGGIGFRRGRF